MTPCLQAAGRLKREDQGYELDHFLIICNNNESDTQITVEGQGRSSGLGAWALGQGFLRGSEPLAGPAEMSRGWPGQGTLNAQTWRTGLDGWVALRNTKPAQRSEGIPKAMQLEADLHFGAR